MDRTRLEEVLNEIGGRCEGFAFAGLDKAGASISGYKPGQPLTESLAYLSELQCLITLALTGRVPDDSMKPPVKAGIADPAGDRPIELMTLEELRQEINSRCKCWAMACSCMPDAKGRGMMDSQWAGDGYTCLGVLAHTMIRLAIGCRGSEHKTHSLDDFPWPPEVRPIHEIVCGNEDPDRESRSVGATYMVGYQVVTHALFKALGTAR